MFSGEEFESFESSSDPVPDLAGYTTLEEHAISTRELEAVAEVRMGEARAPLGGTIIPTDHSYTENGNDDSENRAKQRKTVQNLRHVGTTTAVRAGTAEETFVDLVVTWVHGFFRFLNPFYSDDDDDDGEPVALSEADVDNLAVFQGKIEDFVRLQSDDDEPSPRKIKRMTKMLANESHAEWERRCEELLPPSVLHNNLIKDMETPLAKLRAYLGTWNSALEHCSERILMDDQFTAHRIPTVNQTDAVRSRLGVMSGVHAWDMRIIGPIGTHCTVGVATRKGPLSSRAGYVSLIGDDAESWGWDLVWGNISHKGRTMGDYPRSIIYQYTQGDIIRLILDCDSGELSFAVNDMAFGVAFLNLPKNVPLFPTIGLVYGNMEVTLIYLGPPPPLRN